MKRNWIFLLCLCLLLMLAACGKTGTQDEEQVAGEFGQYKAGEFLEIMMGNTYYMDASAYVMGIETNIVMAVDGQDTSVRMTGIGFPVRILGIDGKGYYLNDDDKTYTQLPETNLPNPEDSGIIQYDQVEYVEGGSSAIEGLSGVDDRTYDYEDFIITQGEDVVNVRYYFDGKTLYAMEMAISEDMIITFVIHDISNQIPEGLLELPSDYTQVEEDALWT